jgi:hypothetical protein
VTKCATNYQAGRDDDRANYNAGAPLDVQTTKHDATECATNYQPGRDDDEDSYNAGAPPDAQATKPTLDGADEDTTRGVTGAPRRDKSGELIPPGYILYKQIKYDMSDFLGSCVRLRQDLTNTGNVQLKPAITPFIDETGDDYGLGAGEAEDGLEAHAYMDMGRTLQDWL